MRVKMKFIEPTERQQDIIDNLYEVDYFENLFSFQKERIYKRMRKKYKTLMRVDVERCAFIELNNRRVKENEKCIC